MAESHRQPRKRSRTLERWIVAALASVYVAFWLLSTRPTVAPPAASAARIEPDGLPASSEVVWLETLPIAERPPIALPDGWRLAIDDASPVAETPTATATPRAPRTVVATRRARIRTRSS